MKKVHVDVFERGTIEESARKVCEEAMEFYAEHAKFAAVPIEDDFGLVVAHTRLEGEIGDVITSIFNYAARNGIDVQRCVDLAETKNISRGYYD